MSKEIQVVSFEIIKILKNGRLKFFYYYIKYGILFQKWPTILEMNVSSPYIEINRHSFLELTQISGIKNNFWNKMSYFIKNVKCLIKC